MANASNWLASPGWRALNRKGRRRLLGYLIGVALGATFTAILLWLPSGTLSLVGAWPSIPTYLGALVVATTAIAAFASAFGLLHINWPDRTGQISSKNLLLGSAIGPMRYGVEAAVGFRTKIHNGTPYVVAVIVLVAGSLPVALAAGCGWAFGRMLDPLERAVGYRKWGDQIGWIPEVFSETQRARNRASVAVVGVSALVLLATLEPGLPS